MSTPPPTPSGDVPVSEADESDEDMIQTLLESPEIQQEMRQLFDNLGRMMTEGMPLYEMRGMKKEHIEAIYAIAYNLYLEGKYEESAHVFRVLCFYDHLDVKHWLALAGAEQMQKKYAEALMSYSYASILDPQNPFPYVHSIECQLGLKQYTEAQALLEALIVLCGEQSEFAAIKKKAINMRNALQESTPEEVK